ncbi:response regulator transcription factor [Chryseolinea sp. H1M3-3]|uniref:response regulator n=1 Tax=Chryseolinea sp. H1M3-3 TaxID=3034144 RepID=UPI0023ED58F1|nr:response regulator transcription factor [Chryseolinea sp. H1M3-3]
MTKIRLLLADDHPLIREGFRSLLTKNERFELVGIAENGKELVELAGSLSPDIILTDINMPVMNGMEAIEQIHKLYPNVKCVILTMHEEREYIIKALKLGVYGYILKNIERFDLEKAIIAVYEGGKYFSPIVTNILAESVVRPEQAPVAELTPREKEVLELVAQGLSTKQVADKLGIGTRTVESHRVNMLKKMKVNNTAELIRKSIEMKIL